MLWVWLLIESIRLRKGFSEHTVEAETSHKVSNKTPTLFRQLITGDITEQGRTPLSGDTQCKSTILNKLLQP